MNDDVKQAYDAIMGKQDLYTRLFQYYDGDQPMVYVTERLRELFKGVDIRFTENWCSVVVDAGLERINLLGLDGPEQAQGQLDRLWQDNELALEADTVHEAALVVGEAFVIAWPDEDGATQVFYNDPRVCHAFYSAENPRQMRMAAKVWKRDDGRLQMTLYYPDRLEYYETAQKAENVSSVAAFKPMKPPTATNPFGEIPVFHFRLSQRVIKGDLVNVVPLQNGINKLMSDMIVAAEYGAFRQRYIISNTDAGSLRNAPNEIWQIPAGDGIGQAASAGEFNATELKNYLDAISQLAGDVGRITRTPKYYFFHQGGDPSGEALVAMESPLNKKCQDRIERFEATWRRLAQFMLRLDGVEVDLSKIGAVWAPVTTVQPKMEAEIRLLNVQAGIPLTTTLRREGWSEQELADMENDQQGSSQALGDKLLTAFEKGV